jgi:hypothetical protein
MYGRGYQKLRNVCCIARNEISFRVCIFESVGYFIFLTASALGSGNAASDERKALAACCLLEVLVEEDGRPLLLLLCRPAFLLASDVAVVYHRIVLSLLC